MLFRRRPTLEVGISDEDRCAVEATSDPVKGSCRLEILSLRRLGEAETGGEG